MIRVGPAGWTYPDWSGIVYPKPAPRGFDPLVYLSRYFDMIEINSTFYRPPSARVATSWARRVRHNGKFRFTAKLWRRFTHEREQAWERADVDAMRDGLDVLANARLLGAVLMQFPWSFRATDENREWLYDLAQVFAEFPLVVEVRHATWNDPQFLGELQRQGVGFANIDQPVFKDSIEPSAHVTSSVGYIRVHGRNYQNWFRATAESAERYDYLYTADELQPWAARAREMAVEHPDADVYVVTNNHARGKGVVNAIMLRSMIGERTLPIAPGLWAEYETELSRLSNGDEAQSGHL
jgi:uncharacterized protein YecE (DUF72 family)